MTDGDEFILIVSKGECEQSARHHALLDLYLGYWLLISHISLWGGFSMGGVLKADTANRIFLGVTLQGMF
jgi:hypothetical protein